MSKWNGKNVLCIGDSITSDGRWQAEFARRTGCNISTHANGGIGLIDMVDGQSGFAGDPNTAVSGKLGPLTVEKLAPLILSSCSAHITSAISNTAKRAICIPSKRRFAQNFPM